MGYCECRGFSSSLKGVCDRGQDWQDCVGLLCPPSHLPTIPHLCHMAVPGPLHQGTNAVFVRSSQSATVLRMVCAMEACTATASASVLRAGLGSAVKSDWVRDAQLFPGTHLLFPGTCCHMAAFPGAG